MEVTYLLAPLIGYLTAGSLNFAINTLRVGQWAFGNIGMGGMPSTHNTITSSTFFAIAFGESFFSPIAAVAFMVGIIVAIDSMDLRRKMEKHAILISTELGKTNDEAKNLVTKLGHRPIEVIVAWALGCTVGYVLVLLKQLYPL
jgi:acid phosphatase family membrane protein YuiD